MILEDAETEHDNCAKEDDDRVESSESVIRNVQRDLESLNDRKDKVCGVDEKRRGAKSGTETCQDGEDDVEDAKDEADEK